jgi:hypothetical protein
MRMNTLEKYSVLSKDTWQGRIVIVYAMINTILYPEES